MKKNYFIMSALMSIGLLTTSCSSSETSEVAETGTHTIAITIQGKSYANGGRAAASFTEANESNIGSSVVVGVFNSDGAIDNITTATVTSTETAGTYTAKVTSKTAAPTIIVAANVPASAFTGAQTKDQFIAKTASLSNTTTSDIQQSGSLPMIGASTAASGTVSVDLYRLVSRICVPASGITSSFDATGAYAGATFTPTEIFMVGVPATCPVVSPWVGSTNAVYAADPTFASGTAYLSGNNTDTGLTDYTAATYLTSGTSYSSTTASYFYVFPRGVYDASTAIADKVRLIIKGTFKMADNTTSTVYYPIVLGRTQTGTTITGTKGNDATYGINAYGGMKSNLIYNIKATIKSKGVTDPSHDIAPADIDVTVTVKDWSNTLTQTVIFN